MKKDIITDLKRLGLHNGSEFISSAFLIKDNRLVAIIALIDRLEARKIVPAHIKHGFNQIRASYQRSGYINQALAVIPFKAYMNEPKENFKADIHWNI
ncbi:hypothetical protein [Kosakonia sp. S42]|uniref:hypothetical protein n=1 Tax=Kosakonia sp. S42 TaxID=2767458 RepID=UPI00190B23AD|nr:hypothetical protein [Kosakonia sp. S42]MBK0019127.1 hypothetical protein [Kosakonia sp. S42]